MLRFPRVEVPEVLTAFAADVSLGTSVNLYHNIEALDVECTKTVTHLGRDIDVKYSQPLLVTSCLGPHVDDAFEQWTILWVIRNDSLEISDCEKPNFLSLPGDVIAINVHKPHSCMPDFAKFNLPQGDRLWVGAAFESPTKPTIKMVSEMVEGFKRSLVLVDGKVSLTPASYHRLKYMKD